MAFWAPEAGRSPCRSLLKNRGHAVSMWEFDKADAQTLAVKREHPLKLPGIIIPDDVVITNDISKAVVGCDYVVCVVPSQTMRATLRLMATTVDRAAISSVRGWIIASKGIECEKPQAHVGSAHGGNSGVDRR